MVRCGFRDGPDLDQTLGGVREGDGSFIKDTKTHDSRAIPIDPVGLLPFLKEIHETDRGKLRSRGLAGAVEIGDCYILSEPGATFATTSYIRRAFKTFSETNGLMGTNEELITFHVLRHTFATQWIRQGGDIKALQSILGHKDAMVTLNAYADIEPISKIHNMLRVSPCLWRGHLGLRVDPGPCSNRGSRSPSRRSRRSATASPSRTTGISSYAT